jgi:UDPglucose--hexose-1-phosphate uridylyltransferase
MSGMGYHEVVIEHAKHNTTLALMSPEDIRYYLETLHTRGWAIQEDGRIEQIVYFKNHGVRAGASLKHPHSQLIALPVVPYSIRHRIDEARRHFDDTGHCAYCTMLQDELREGTRVIAENEFFVAFVLYAAPSPFHTWIFPRRHRVSFLYAQSDELTALAQLLRDVLRRLYIGLRDPAYNLIIRSSPVKEISNEYLHWYVTIVPRLNRSAGFELGSGIFINPSIPEEGADFLRNIKI